MKFFETSNYESFKKSTYINLRWIGIIGQLVTINFVYFILNFKFNFFISSLVIIIGVISNLYLVFIYKNIQLSERLAFVFLVIDILQLGTLLYLTGGVTNPFVIFLLIPNLIAFCSKLSRYLFFELDVGPTIKPWNFFPSSFEINSIKLSTPFHLEILVGRVKMVLLIVCG